MSFIAHTYRIKIGFGFNQTEFLMYSKTNPYPEEFLKQFCEDIANGIKETKAKEWKKFLGISRTKPIPPGEKFYEYEYLGKLKHQVLDYDIIHGDFLKDPIVEEQKAIANGRTEKNRV